MMVTVPVLARVSNKLSPSSFKYTVQDGDTCGKIAASLSVSVISIIKINRLQMDCKDIYIGKVLLIPRSTPSALPSTTNPNIVVECERANHLVAVDDTLTSIANQYEIPKAAITFFNGLEGEIVKPGTQLIIPLCYSNPSR